MQSHKKGTRGITLTEVLVIVIIIGILAALALPQFTAQKERALSKEAKANLKLINAAEKIYRMELGFYFPYPASPQPQVDDQISTNLKVVLNPANWDYNVTSSATSTFTSAAIRNSSAPGTYNRCRYYITESMNEPDKVAANATDCP